MTDIRHALLARIRELEADAEAVRAETTRQTDRRIDAYRALEAENHELRRDIERLKAEHWTDSAVRVEAENARLRKVLKAATAMRNCSSCDIESNGHGQRLIQALDAFALWRIGAIER